MKANLTEADVSFVFEDFISSRDWSRRYSRFIRIVREMQCQQGRPDLVATPSNLRMSPKKLEGVSSALSRPSSALVLSLLKRFAPRSEIYLLKVTNLSKPAIKRSIQELESASLIRRTSSGYVQTDTLGKLPDEIWAFEVKVENWRRALYQALQYRAFAHRVVVVFSERWIHRILKHLDQFKNHNVGIVSVNVSSRSCRLLLHPNKNRPSSRYHHLFALGHFLNFEQQTV